MGADLRGADAREASWPLDYPEMENSYTEGTRVGDATVALILRSVACMDVGACSDDLQSLVGKIREVLQRG